MDLRGKHNETYKIFTAQWQYMNYTSTPVGCSISGTRDPL